jgi:hypothetical protein
MQHLPEGVLDVHLPPLQTTTQGEHKDGEGSGLPIRRNSCIESLRSKNDTHTGSNPPSKVSTEGTTS